MPRAAKTSSRRHAPAVSLSKRSFAAPAATEQVLPGAAPETTLADLRPLTKHEVLALDKPKQPLKPFLGAIKAGAAQTPYSRSHVRREKRKARQQLAGGDLGGFAAALAEAAGDAPPPPKATMSKEGKSVVEAPVPPQARKREPDGRIGQGSAKTMGEKKRRQQIAASSIRVPAVLAHPAFKTNPWATIREHASNSLATAEAATSVQERKRAAKATEDARPKVKLPPGLAGMPGSEGMEVRSAGGMDGIE